MSTIQEPARELPVRSEYDVIVCGGGLGGVAAAIAAARAGAGTLLVERNSFVGGVATAGMCCSIFNCFYTGGGERRPGSTGICVEVADAMAEAMGYGKKWHDHKGHVIYDIELGKQVLEQLAVDAGVEILYSAVVAGAVVEDACVKGIILESKSGREAVLAKVVVDSTADADVAASAGVPLHLHEHGIHSLCFRMGNVDTDAFVEFFRQDPDQYPAMMDVEWTTAEALAQYDDCGTFLFPHGGGMVMDAFQQAKADGVLPPQIGIQDTTDACQMHAMRRTGIVHVVTGFTRFDGLDEGMISRSIIDGRRMAHVVAEAYRRYMPGFGDAYVAGTAANLGIRTSRYLDGDFVFTAEMLASGRRHPDAVGKVIGWGHPILNEKAKKMTKGAFSCQVLNSEPADLPYRCLLPREIDGLLVGAGRSISTDNPSLLRVMVHTMVVGQAAGTAAAVAVTTGATPGTVQVEAIQAALERQGVTL